MADCINEITGVQIISLYPSDSVRLVRPDISNENEVNLISDGEDSYIISDPVLLPKWERVVGYSGNYKQNYSDEFTFLAFGIENGIPAIIKELRDTRVGYVVEIKTIGDSNYVFQSPVFLNNANTKRIDSHSWQISLSYRIPSFLDKLTNLETILGTESEVLPCDKEIQGIKSISLYDNFVLVDGVSTENIDYNYPDLSNENEVDVIVFEDVYLTVDQVKEQPKWERIINYSENYKQNYNDEFTFLLHGIENDIPETIKTLRNNRLGYIAVITTTNNKNYIFPSPIFLNENNTKQVDSHSWAVSLSYRVPSFENKLTVLDISFFVESIDITLNMSTPSTAGITLTFASGALNEDWKEGGGLVPFVSTIELLHTYTTPGTYIAETSGDFGNITKLIADNSKITDIDLALLVAATDIRLYSNLLTVLDVSKNTALDTLYCYNNSLTILDLSTNIALENLYCYNNSLASLNISNNTALKILRGQNNLLASLDVSNNTALTLIYCYDNLLTTLDASANTALTLFYCYNNSLTTLDVSNNTLLTQIRCNNNSLTALDISSNTVLVSLNCFTNSIATLDVSNNTALKTLLCQGNGMSAASVDNIYIDLDAHGLSNGTLTITAGNTARTAASDAANTSLIGKGWTIA